MKPIVLCLALASFASAPPCAAQTGAAPTTAAPTNAVPPKPTPEQAAQLAREMQTIFRAARRLHHRDLTPQNPPLVRTGSVSSAPVPLPPQQMAILKQQAQLHYAAANSLHAGNYAQAQAQQALSLGQDGVAAEVLAAVLAAQGKDQEALQAYQTVTDHYDVQPRNLLPYSLLLLKSGQWAQAVTFYNSAENQYPDGDLIRTSSHFTPDVPQPAALAVALHVALGRTYNGEPGWADGDQNMEAMAEYGKALQLAPDSDLANYYYGVGWQQLTPAERAQFGTAQQAKTALLKAVKIGRADVKKAAQ